jgi:hypothetical protein
MVVKTRLSVLYVHFLLYLLFFVCVFVSLSVRNINYYYTGWMAEESDFDSRQANVIHLFSTSSRRITNLPAVLALEMLWCSSQT